MFCSTVIATVGRPTLSRSVISLLEQVPVAGDFEVIVVNDSGRPLSGMAWLASPKITVVHTQCRERSVARNTGAAIAVGRYLNFLDDDDWLLPGALQTFRSLANTHPVAWLYGSAQLVDRRGKPIIPLRHELAGNCFTQVMAGEWIPLQASLVETKAFFAVGGFTPQLSGPEDIDLLRRIALRCDIAGIEEPIACIARGETGSTTDYGHHAGMSRWAREVILDSPGVFARMRTSSRSSYWRGRVVRVYLTSMLWNLRRKRLLQAASRAVRGVAGVALASPHLLSSRFWRAVVRPYASEAFARGFRDAEAFGNSPHS
jgi:glycosyltransferase involved in cell wall biosynthesis